MPPPEGGLPARLLLAAGDSVELELPGLGGAGYLWESSVDGPGDTVELSWHRGGDARAVGAGMPERLHVTALSPGSVRVLLAQRRPWEAGVPPRAQHELDVVVQGPPQTAGRGFGSGTDSP